MNLDVPNAYSRDLATRDLRSVEIIQLDLTNQAHLTPGLVIAGSSDF